MRTNLQLCEFFLSQRREIAIDVLYIRPITAICDQGFHYSLTMKEIG